jgi:large subunit ribosomal protein L17
MAYSRLRRNSAQRKALLRDLVTDLIINERITTTLSKAKELRKFADKAITLGKKGDLAAIRQVASFVRKEEAGNGQDAVQKLFKELAPRYKDRNGGYTRIIKVGPRQGDNAPMAIIEYIK